MEIDLLRTFLTIYDLGSFTGAARKVGRTQSAVSQQMRRLEESLGRPLFVRGTTSISLTEHGVMLLERARTIVESVDEARALFDRGSVEGVVVLGMPDEYAPRLLQLVCREFAALYPEATLDLVFDESRGLVTRLAEGSVDIAFVTEGEGPVAGGPEVFRDRIVWVGPASGTLHESDPLPLAIWDRSDGYSRRMFPALDRMDRGHRIAVASRSMTGLRGAVTSGIAVTAMMESSIVPGMRRLTAKDGFPELDTLAVTLERAHLKQSPIVGALERRLVEVLTGDRAA